MPEVGDFLGQMTDELGTYGAVAYIIKYVSGGPKNYAIKIYSPMYGEIFTVVKVKGITLNYERLRMRVTQTEYRSGVRTLRQRQFETFWYVKLQGHWYPE